MPAGRDRRRSGIDALLHALEAYTVVPYDTRPAPPARRAAAVPGREPVLRPALRARDRARRPKASAPRSPTETTSRRARRWRSRRRSPGIAFSGAGVHVPHALAYPIASLQHEWQPPGYGGAALVPARLRGRGDRTGRVPLHRRRRAGAVRDRGPAARRRGRPRGLARTPDGGRRRADAACARSATARTTCEAIVPRRARPAAAARRLAEGGRRGRARGAAEGVAVSDGAWPRASPSSAPGRWASASRTSSRRTASRPSLVDSTPELAEAARARSLELLARLEAAGSVERGRDGDGASDTSRPRRRSRGASTAPTWSSRPSSSAPT